MKALVKKYAQKGLWLEDVEEPKCLANDVKIKIHKTAICGTDLHIYNWDEWSQQTIIPPLVIGHEYVGEIVEMENRMMEKDVYVVAFSYPVVPKGKARIRTQISAQLSEEDILTVVEKFKEVKEEMGL